MENFVDGDGSNGRGTDGPLKVSTVPDQNPLYDSLFEASKASGFKTNPDYNSEDQEGVVKTQASIYKGRRMSVAHCYIEPAMKRPNLHVVTNAHTLRVLLEGKRCVGVEYEKDGKVVQIRANETILSAGGVASPQILELSGIGQPELLKKHGIEVKHELKAVGETFRDHINARFRLIDRLRGQNGECIVIGHIAITDHAIMPMIGIGVECHITHQAKLRKFRLQRARSAAH